MNRRSFFGVFAAMPLISIGAARKREPSLAEVNEWVRKRMGENIHRIYFAGGDKLIELTADGHRIQTIEIG